jgi:peptidoglycan hydrolase-like protein with peptidoglycan-binding domain
MAFSLIWLPHVLESAGLKVALVPGWEDCGRGDVHAILGVICHHTAGERRGNMPSLQTLINGRSDLAGPLAQLGLGRDGTFYVIAAGRCNHAGAGIWNGVTNGNSNFIGIEAENTGGANDFPWPDVQVDACQRGVAAILKFVGQPANACAGHKEYARPVGRKSDPIFNMDDFRDAVSAILDGTAPAPVLIAAAEPARGNGDSGRPTLRRGDAGALVTVVQVKLDVVPAGPFGPRTEAAVREFQRRIGFVPDGIVGPKTWGALDALP